MEIRCNYTCRFKGIPVTNISNSVFANEQKREGYDIEIRSIVIPDSVISIGSENVADNGAFKGCVNLTKVVLPDSLTNIEAYSFYGCSNLSSIYLPESVKEISFHAFARSGLTSITFPDTVDINESGALKSGILEGLLT